jgi:hypothetical protein
VNSAYKSVRLKRSLETSGSWLSVSHPAKSRFTMKQLTSTGGGSEEIMSELAIREEVKDLKKYAKAASKL